ncbi:MAG: TetR/AcrR family transcriptional regulator [Finegoldia magna]|uniref:TetR/AcrR family transcriptional regulator n=1 Tax=Finegoldia magna TaxID=1260 RepID=UPI00290C1664|nr:TetR/AcrR family transcriptional regulator [Finegoldia magna]MDU5224087.1 TetR/AcrR family transcriptional regulator [Finegoldia magna]
MPKQTFYNLSEDKRNLIDEVLKDEFSTKPYKDCNVKNIVERLSIARGSFYQYFDDLMDSYFYILDKETKDVHLLFMSVLKKNNNDVSVALDAFGDEVCDVIFEDSEYNLYKFRYLYWNSELEYGWRATKNEYYEIFHDNSDCMKQELVYFMKAIVHSLIERNFKEEWSRDIFIEKYNLHINWLKRGVENENI